MLILRDLASAIRNLNSLLHSRYALGPSRHHFQLFWSSTELRLFFLRENRWRISWESHVDVAIECLDQKIWDGCKNYISCWFCVFGSGIVIRPLWAETVSWHLLEIARTHIHTDNKQVH